ncbi:hypothetical protein [Amycolatopsis taiwanensis]|uniref:hypothetical protein n=1 Tax=Amycolatopsis taiwanensis TaxID=342230 RepID=UPI000482CD05|nr:hypothetical protein [Amycolatopsis taiwanensis]
MTLTVHRTTPVGRHRATPDIAVRTARLLTTLAALTLPAVCIGGYARYTRHLTPATAAVLAVLGVAWWVVCWASVDTLQQQRRGHGRHRMQIRTRLRALRQRLTTPGRPWSLGQHFTATATAAFAIVVAAGILWGAL